MCDQPLDFQAYGGTRGKKMSFLHFHGGYIDTRHPAKCYDELSQLNLFVYWGLKSF
jgi:hypothetical protein